MDSLDAQCLVLDLAEGEVQPPNLWCHESPGALTWAFGGGERSFTWQSEAVADMAARWRAQGHDPPATVRRFVEAHLRFVEMLDESGLTPPDAVIHDLAHAEIRARWDEQKLVVIIEKLDEVPVEA